jgi:hypothetical protein
MVGHSITEGMNIATDTRLQRPEIGGYDADPSDTRQSLMVDLTRPQAEIRQLEADTGPHRKLHRAQADRARDVQAHAAHYMQKIGLALAPRPMVFAHARANLSAGRPRAIRRTAARSGSRGDPDEPPAALAAEERHRAWLAPGTSLRAARGEFESGEPTPRSHSSRGVRFRVLQNGARGRTPRGFGVGLQSFAGRGSLVGHLAWVSLCAVSFLSPHLLREEYR